MTHPRTPRVPEGTFFFTLCLADRSSTLLEDRADLLQAVIAEVRKQRGFTVDTFVILPGRIHAIWTMPAGEADYLGCWTAIKKMFGQTVSSAPDAIWQPRVKAFAIRSPADLERHRKTCRDAPVDAGLVAEPADWPHASFHMPRQARHAA